MPFSRSRSQHIFRRVIHHAQKPSSAFVDQKAVTNRKASLLIADHSCSAHNSRHLNDCPARWRLPKPRTAHPVRHASRYAQRRTRT